MVVNAVTEKNGKPAPQRFTIGLITAWLDNYYQNTVLNGVADVANERGANLICFAGGSLRSIYGESTLRGEIYNRVDTNQLSGLVVMSSFLIQAVNRERLQEFCESFRPLPMVSIGVVMEDIPCIRVDNHSGMREELLHLISVHGYRRIAFIRGPQFSNEAEQRYRTYASVLAEHEIPLDPDLIAYGDFEVDQSVEAMNLLLDRRKARFDAVVAANDLMASGAMEALRSRGINIPVVGFDDEDSAQFLTPPLTTVRQPVYELGRQAAEMLLAKLRGEEVPLEVMLPTKLIIRQSCGCFSPSAIQAAVQTVPPSSETLNSAFGTHRERIVGEMVQSLEPPLVHIALGWAEQLLDAFTSEMRDKNTIVFLKTLNDVLRKVMLEGRDVALWNGVLSALRRHALPYLDDETMSRAENLWQQARVLIGEMAQQAQAHRTLRMLKQHEKLREITQALIITVNEANLRDVLEEGLPRLGINICYLSLYEGKDIPAEWSRMILAFEGKKKFELEAGGLRIPNSALIPADFLPQSRRYSLVIEPLYFRDEHLGYAAFELGPRDGSIYETLRGQLSTALKGTQLVQQVKNQATTLSAANEQLQREMALRKQVEEQLAHQAFHDSLTGLPNRALFLDRLNQTASHAKRSDAFVFAVLFLDLDRFKVINDSLGHEIGDKLLCLVARRLEKCVRPGDTVARLGGDEFTILLDDIKHISDPARVASRIQKELKEFNTIDGHDIFTSASIGITLSAVGYNRPEDLIRDADAAMYRAKSLGKARHVMFNWGMHDHVMALLKSEMDLWRGIERQEFKILYQPIISLETGKIVSFEALVHWQHPERGLLSAVDFINTAEETGAIIRMGRWVMREACLQTKAWHIKFPSNDPLAISVNLSNKEFAQPDLITQIGKLLVETGLPGRSLTLEIAEKVIMGNTEAQTIKLLKLKDLEVQLYIDDFGSDRSSLARLHRLPIRSLKIDRSFISKMEEPQDMDVIKTIMMVAENLHMSVTAEGVETEEQFVQLKALKCHFAQGYYFSKPLIPEEAEALYETNPQW